MGRRGTWYFMASLAITLVFLFPVFWMISTSLKIGAHAWAIPPEWPFPSLDNYKYVLFETNFFKWFINSMIICSVATAATLAIGVPAAYALSRFKIRGKENIFFFILTTRMGPPIAFAIPFYLIFLRVGLIDTHLVLIILYMLMNIALVVWITRSFFDKIPREIAESASVDGLTKFKTFKKLDLPLASEGIFTAAIFTFIFSWNEYFFALLFTRTFAKTLPAYMPSFLVVKEFLWGEMCAAATLVIIPVIILIFIIHKHLTRGFTLGMVE